MSVREIPYKALVGVDAINARAASKDGVAELADSIAGIGLTQALTVRPSAEKADRYEIIDGRRRWLALTSLVKSGKAGWSKASPVPVLVRNEDDVGALQTSLIANTVRLPMHPVDQHAVFARLVEGGTREDDIAARFGLSARQVRQQLALGRLAPAVRDAWRKGQLEAEAAQAFTVDARHEQQEAALARLRKQYGRQGRIDAYGVRRELAGGRVAVAHVPAAVLARYTAKGGILDEDLFSDGAGYAKDALLLKVAGDEIRAEVAAATRDRLAGQGWAWVAASDELPHQHRWEWARLEPIEMTPEQEDHHNKLLADVEEVEEAGNGDIPEAVRRQAIADAYQEEIELAGYTPEQRASAGAVFTVHHSGEVDISFGLIKPDGVEIGQEADEDDDSGMAGAMAGGEVCPDCAGVEPDDCDTCGGTGRVQADDGDLPPVGATLGQATAAVEAEEADDSPTISFALRQTLGEAQTRAVAAVIVNDAGLAMRLAIAALCTTSHASPVKLSIDQNAHDRPPTDAAFTRKLAAAMALHSDDVPGKLASLIARSLSLVPVGAQDTTTTLNADSLVELLRGDVYGAFMREAFLPDDYFKRASKAVALAALDEMRESGATAGLAPRPELEAMLKTHLANAAAAQAIITGWLPPELRHPAYTLLAPAQREEAA